MDGNRRAHPAGPQTPVPSTEALRVSEREMTATLLADAFGEALAQGVFLAARGAALAEVRAWTRRQLPALEHDLPGLFGADTPYRGPSVATLQTAAEIGYEARRAFEARERGEEPDVIAPRGYSRATLPPHPEWLEHEARELVGAHASACEFEGLTPLDPDLVLESARDLKGTTLYSVITDQGVHRVRSSFLRDPEDGRLYQLIVVREGRETTIYRRYCGETDSHPVLVGFRTEELDFLREAFSRIQAELTPRGV
jgi:hypothetical protein